MRRLHAGFDEICRSPIRLRRWGWSGDARRSSEDGCVLSHDVQQAALGTQPRPSRDMFLHFVDRLDCCDVLP
jgi:hypothetical protein